MPSSRKIARKLEEDIAFRVLAANNTPDFRTISDFRKDHLKALAALFVQVFKLFQAYQQGVIRQELNGRNAGDIKFPTAYGSGVSCSGSLCDFAT